MQIFIYKNNYYQNSRAVAGGVELWGIPAWTAVWAALQYACKKITEKLKRDPDLRHTIATIERNLGVNTALGL